MSVGPQLVAQGHAADVAVVDRAVERVVRKELRHGGGHVEEAKSGVVREADEKPLHVRAEVAAVDGVGAERATWARAGVHQQRVAALDVLSEVGRELDPSG